MSEREREGGEGGKKVYFLQGGREGGNVLLLHAFITHAVIGGEM